MATAGRAFILSRVTDLSVKPIHHPHPLPLSFSRHLLSTNRRRSSALSPGLTVSCLSGGVSDDFVSTRKSSFDRGFSVIANLLKRIEPLDTSVISQGVSDSARDSMKQTISTMLGLLPSEQFSVTVSVSKQPLDRLLASSIITGYTLWNAEYRIALTRNLDLSGKLNSSTKDEVSTEQCKESDNGEGEVGVVEMSFEDFERSPQLLGDLPPEALNYIQQLQSELSSAKEELNAQKQENMQTENGRGNRNDLLEYLRSLDNDMVTELSRPSSIEVEEIIHQLVQNVLRRLFQDDTTLDFMGKPVMRNTENNQDGADELCNRIDTSRDYLAKLLFWLVHATWSSFERLGEQIALKLCGRIVVKQIKQWHPQPPFPLLLQEIPWHTI